MTSSSPNVAPWQVWLAYVRFADRPEIGKVRPVVIIDSETAAMVAAKITSAAPLTHYRYYELMDWEKEGLLKPSRIQLAPLLALHLEDLLNDEPLGSLSKRDRAALTILLEDRKGTEVL